MSLQEIGSAGIAAASVAASTDILADDAVVSNPAVVAANTVIEPVVESHNVTPEVVADKPTKERKVKKVKAAAKPAKPAKKVVAKKGKSPGRPPVFVGKVKTEITRLIRKHGITGTRDILAAKKGDLVAHRNADIVPKPLSISLPTLVKLGQKANITLKRGRRAA